MENTMPEVNRVYALLAALLDKNPEFDYRRTFVKFSTAPDRAALLYARQKLAELAATLDQEREGK